MDEDQEATRKLTDLTDSEIGQLPLDKLSLVVLRHLVDTGEWNSYNFLLNVNHPTTRLGFAALKCLSEALNWLISKNLVARGTPGKQGNDAIFVTRQGTLVLEKGLDVLLVRELLDINLHITLQKVQSQFLMGEYELAAFSAMREVEIRVRELSKSDSSLLGVKLMRQAFRIGGSLADPDLDPGEQTGIMELFSGAIGTFKNPPSHRQVDYTDPTEASEVILLADLLMRILGRIESRLR